MVVAIRTDNGELVSSDELPLIENPAKYQYTCRECSVPMFPASFRPENIIAAHFRVYSSTPHTADCSVVASSPMQRQASTQRITSKNGFPLTYPSVFNRQTEARKENQDENATTGKARQQRGSNSSSHNPQQQVTPPSTTSSFSKVVRSYFDFPFDKDRALNFEGVKGKTYEEVFHKIENTKGNQYYRLHPSEEKQGCTKVFYAPLARQDKKKTNKFFLNIPLFAGRWNKSSNSYQNQYTLRIQRNKENRKSFVNLINKLNKAIDTVNNHYDKQTVTLVFVGRQQTPPDDTYTFYPDENLQLIDFISHPTKQHIFNPSLHKEKKTL